MRCGVLFSQNPYITHDRKMLAMNCYLGAVPPVVQEKLRRIITDKGGCYNTMNKKEEEMMMMIIIIMITMVVGRRRVGEGRG